MYRPAGWAEKRDECARRDWGELALGHSVNFFETGADAMLQELLNSPDSYAPDSLILKDKLKSHKFGKGRLVFIPEED